MHFFLNARSALYHTLKAYDIGEWDEVLITAWNCVSVVNLVKQSRATPVYVDISKDTLWMQLESFEKRLSDKTKLIVLQETFWIPGEFDEIIKLCKQRRIKIVMDGAHSFGNALYENIDAYVYSFGRDKVLSSVNGWLLVFSLETPTYIQNLELKEISQKECNKHLYYNIFAYIAYKTYAFLKIGKCIMALARRVHLFPEILSSREKQYNFKDFWYAYPQKLYPLLLLELERSKGIEEHRSKLGSIYMDTLKDSKLFWFPSKTSLWNFFRVPLTFLSNERELRLRENLVAFMKYHQVYVWITWSWAAISPLGSNIEESWITKYSVPLAHDLTENIVFLPNHRNIKEKDVKRVIKLLREFEMHYVQT